MSKVEVQVSDLGVSGFSSAVEIGLEAKAWVDACRAFFVILERGVRFEHPPSFAPRSII